MQYYTRLLDYSHLIVILLLKLIDSLSETFVFYFHICIYFMWCVALCGTTHCLIANSLLYGLKFPLITVLFHTGTGET